MYGRATRVHSKDNGRISRRKWSAEVSVDLEIRALIIVELKENCKRLSKWKRKKQNSEINTQK